jgi:chromate transport protein ChrA
LLIAIVLSLLLLKTKISPALLILLSGAFGAVFLRS